MFWILNIQNAIITDFFPLPCNKITSGVSFIATIHKRIQKNRKIRNSIGETEDKIVPSMATVTTQNILIVLTADFQAFLNFCISSGDTILKNHFNNLVKNATYRSKSTQNKLIQLCGDQITQWIREKINRNTFYSILADEASECSRKEQLALIMRYIDRENRISERFLRF